MLVRGWDLMRQEGREDLAPSLLAFTLFETIAHRARHVRREADAFVFGGGLGEAELVESHRNADFLRGGHRG